jgi:hypothetical protein
MVKMIQDAWSIQYKKNLESLQNHINPKPSKAERERRIQIRLKRRENNGSLSHGLQKNDA